MDSPHYCDGLVIADGTINPAIRREHGELRSRFASLPEFHETLSIEELKSRYLAVGWLECLKHCELSEIFGRQRKSIVDDLYKEKLTKGAGESGIKW